MESMNKQPEPEIEKGCHDCHKHKECFALTIFAVIASPDKLERILGGEAIAVRKRSTHPIGYLCHQWEEEADICRKPPSYV